MNKLLWIFCFLIMLAACAATNKREENVSERTLLVFYEAENGKNNVLGAARRKNAQIIYDYRYINAVALTIAPGANMEKMIRFFSKTPGVLSVQRDRLMQLGQTN